MLKRTSRIFAKDANVEITVNIEVRQREFGSSNATQEASTTLKTVEDEITAAVFTTRFFARNIRFSAGPD